MAELTRSFNETVKRRIEREPAFREALLAEAVDCLMAGEVDVGKLMLRDVTNATAGFETLAAALDLSTEKLVQMLSANGDPTAKSLFAVIRELQRILGVHLSVAAVTLGA